MTNYNYFHKGIKTQENKWICINTCWMWARRKDNTIPYINNETTHCACAGGCMSVCMPRRGPAACREGKLGRAVLSPSFPGLNQYDTGWSPTAPRSAWPSLRLHPPTHPLPSAVHALNYLVLHTNYLVLHLVLYAPPPPCAEHTSAARLEQQAQHTVTLGNK